MLPFAPEPDIMNCPQSGPRPRPFDVLAQGCLHVETLSPKTSLRSAKALLRPVAEQHVAVIGTGHWGKDLVRTFDKLGALGAVCDADQGRVNALRTNDTVRHYCRVNDCLFDPEISAVVIATPAVSHFELVRSALKAGKDVFVEKPLALTVREGSELVKLAADMDLMLMVGNVLRYNPAIRRLKEMIDAGELGKVEYIYSSRLNTGRLLSEENILWSFAPHEVSVIIGLLGDMPVTASCQGGDYVSRGVSDVTVSQLVFPGGVRAQIFASWLRPFREQRLVVAGSDKMAVFDDAAVDRLMVYPRGDSWDSAQTEGEAVETDAIEPMMVECLTFLESLETRQPPLTDGAEELRVLEVLDACERSLSNDGVRAAVRDKAPSGLVGDRIGQLNTHDAENSSVNGFGEPILAEAGASCGQPTPA